MGTFSAPVRTLGAVLVAASLLGTIPQQDTSAAWLTYGEAAYQDGWFAEAVVQSPDRYATFMADKRAHQEDGVTLVE